MKTIHSLMTASLLGLLLISGSAVAQTPSPTSPTGPGAVPGAAPPATAPAGKVDPALEAKWKALDKDGKGLLDGAAIDPFKSVMKEVDVNSDGKISKDEFMNASKAGIIKQ